MSLTGIAVKLAVPLPKITEFERILMIGPHPDDIEIGAGATAALLAQQGKKVCFLICTDGRFGDGAANGIKGEALCKLREQEAIASANCLGVSDVRFLKLKDGAGYTMAELEAGIAGVIGDFKPDIVFAPDPLSKSECHADHLNVGFAARKLACFAPYPGIMDSFGAGPAAVKAVAFYMTAHANCYVATRGNLKKQMKAIFENHLSQYPADSPDTAALKLYLKIRSADFGLRSLKPGGAEGFRVLEKTHMHCLPEAGE